MVDNNSLIPGQFQKGDRLVFADFMDLKSGSIVWGQSDRFNGPLQMDATEDNFRSLTDGDKIGMGIEFPSVAADSPVAVFTDFGQMEFYEAEPVFEDKD